MKYRLMSFFARFMGRLRPETLRALARAMTFLFWHLQPKRRAMAIEAMEKHLGIEQEEARAE